MAHYRRCEACNDQTTTCQVPHPYLKRSSRSYTVTNKPMKCSNPVQTEVSSVDVSIDNATRAKAANLDLATKAHVGADVVSPSKEMGFDQRTEAANDKASKLLAEARQQLAAPSDVSNKFIDDEKPKKAAAPQWANNDEKKQEKIEGVERNNDMLFQGVSGIADSLVMQETAIGSEVGSAQMEAPSLTQSKIAFPDLSEDRLVKTMGQSQSLVDDISMSSCQSPSVFRELPSAFAPHPESVHRPHRSKVSTQEQTNVDNSSGATLNKIKKKPAPEKPGWHTLWSYNFEANW